MKKIISIENLSKKYLIYQERTPTSDSLKAVISKGIKNCFKRIFKPRSLKKEFISSLEEIWALKDVTLDIHEGDRIALLGRNGAGKSTLFKILSRITEPTKGYLKIKGRVSSLLEVGTGFHPDLTGRENILLNGSILGMSYNEIKNKFDEIVAFADIEKFLDTPIKRYSSGMFMRLGFAIAAHLDSDILIIDEVLAVGDTQFQEKCLKKMREKGNEGKTILFVSHHIDSVLALCDKGILLEQGTTQGVEPIEQCISRYVQNCPAAGLNWQGNLGDNHIRIHRASLRAPSANHCFFYHGDKAVLDLEFEILKPHSDLMLGFKVLNSREQLIARSRLCDDEDLYHTVTQIGPQCLSFQLDLDLFYPGEYQIKVECSLLNKMKIIENEVMLKFAVCSQNKQIKYEMGTDREGISLGSKWCIADQFSLKS